MPSRPKRPAAAAPVVEAAGDTKRVKVLQNDITRPTSTEVNLEAWQVEAYHPDVKHCKIGDIVLAVDENTIPPTQLVKTDSGWRVLPMIGPLSKDYRRCPTCYCDIYCRPKDRTLFQVCTHCLSISSVATKTPCWH